MPHKNKDEEKVYYAGWYGRNRERKIAQANEYEKVNRERVNRTARARNARYRE